MPCAPLLRRTPTHARHKTSLHLVSQRVEPTPGIGLGRPVQRILQGTNRVHHGPNAVGLAETALTGQLPHQQYAPTK
jgi:hypothetical protein